ENQKDKHNEQEQKTKKKNEQNKQENMRQYGVVFAGKDFTVVDNHDWFKDMGYMAFLRDVGKHVPMSQMLGREFIQTRLGEGGSGISYAEFSYALIQGYDFLYLYREHGVTLQLCGADQWGNSLAGVELIRRIAGGEANVLSLPLIINKATGRKFGKSEGGAVWLDPEQTSAYQFYQFWLNVDDEGVVDYMKVYTLLDRAEIEAVARDFDKDRSSRIAQKTLAYEVTKLVHGQAKADAVVHATAVLFGATQELSADVVEVLRGELPVVKASDDTYAVIVEAGLASSKSEARNFVSSGAISVNGVKVTPESENVFEKPVNLVKRGKNTFALVEQ
ncbi:tyrosine--tRNA ligase, partial [Patescibacteria group bacterium]